MDKLDLNLLRVLDALLETGSVTSAAGRLHMSAPATSRALGRLRRAMGDPILTRAGRGLVPTTFAQQIAPRVRAIIDDADSLSENLGEDPSAWRRTFSIRINDALAPTLAPLVLERVSLAAPHLRVRFTGPDSKDPDLLRDGTLDLDIGIRVASPSDVLSTPLLTDRFVAAVRADSDLGRKNELETTDLVVYPHISASRRGLAYGPLDDALEAVGLHRRVVAVAPSYIVAALMTLEGDVICLLPRLMTEHLIGRGLRLRAHSVPLDLPKVHVEARWHARADADAVSRWMRVVIKEVARNVRNGG